MKIFSGSFNKPLAEKIADHLGLILSPVEVFVFPDGERRIKLNERVVDDDTIVVQSTATPVDNSYTELFFIIDALKRSGARSVTVVMPYVGYQRQDHVFRDGEAVSLKVMIKILESLKVDRIITLDLHSIKIPEFFHIPQIELSALPMFAEKIKGLMGVGSLSHVADGARPFADEDSDLEQSSLSEKRSGADLNNDNENKSVFNSSASGQSSHFFENAVLVSPDMGGLRRIKMISSDLDSMPWIATVKDRDLATGEIQTNRIEGELPDTAKTAFIVDDMTSSGKTIIEAIKLLKEKGFERFFAFVTHPIFSSDAPILLQRSDVEKVFVTDSVFVPEEKRFEKLETLSVAEMIAEELNNIK